MEHKYLYRHILKQAEGIENHHPEFYKLFQYLSGITPLPNPQTISESKQMISSLKHSQLKFMAKTIFKELQLLSFKQSETFQIGDFTITIQIYSTQDESFFLHQMKYVLRFILSLFKSSTTKSITINYYLIDEQKMRPQKEIMLNYEHINSGMCSYKTGICEIHIWRKEEILKVTIHELLHGLHSVMLTDTPTLISMYQSKYNISSKEININETYTELWANILNCFLISFTFQTNVYQYFTMLLKAEQIFCSYQTNTIKQITQLGEKVIDINQHTNVLAYYIIRCELFQQLPTFLEYCRKYNKNYMTIKTEFIKQWQQFFQKQQQTILHFTEPPFSIKTLRMSINEINMFRRGQIHHPYSDNEPS